MPFGGFVVTKQHRLFTEFCAACGRYRYIGLCYGPPGVGKTLSARQYAHWDLVEPLLPKYYAPGFTPPPTVSACRTVLYTAPVTNTPGQIAHQVHWLGQALRFLAEQASQTPSDRNPWRSELDGTDLVIVDEADRLTMTSLEQLRDIYDHEQVGLILIGMPGIEKRLARYPQLYSRVGFVHQFRPLSPEEMQFVLENKWHELRLKLEPDDFTDAEAVAAIIRITAGNFRLIHRLLTQIERVLQINQLNTVTKEVVETARESLVIGVA